MKYVKIMGQEDSPVGKVSTLQIRGLSYNPETPEKKKKPAGREETGGPLALTSRPASLTQKKPQAHDRPCLQKQGGFCLKNNIESSGLHVCRNPRVHTNQ